MHSLKSGRGSHKQSIRWQVIKTDTPRSMGIWSSVRFGDKFMLSAGRECDAPHAKMVLQTAFDVAHRAGCRLPLFVLSLSPRSAGFQSC